MTHLYKNLGKEPKIAEIVLSYFYLFPEVLLPFGLGSIAGV